MLIEFNGNLGTYVIELLTVCPFIDTLRPTH